MITKSVLTKESYQILDMLANLYALERDYTHNVYERWEVQSDYRNDKKRERALLSLGTLKYVNAGTTFNYLIDAGNALIRVTVTKKAVSGYIDTTHEAISAEIFKTLRGIFAKLGRIDNSSSLIKFVNYSPTSGPIINTREVSLVPSWDSIKENYNANVQEAFSNLVTLKPHRGGQIILLHGMPGTGKTYAIRSLLQEWRSFSSPYYIIDPESLFGESAYLMNMLFEATQFDENGEEIEESNNHWKLLIMEDTGELLAEDAKVRTGQGLSRLLNITDGFIGQGLNLLLIMTTNEDISSLHPAVARPGRCLAKIEFGRLSGDESNDWLMKRGIDTTISPRTLAELYEISSGSTQVKNVVEKRSVGFGK